MAIHEHRGLFYELVISRRAKRASLRVVPGRGLIVSIPYRFPKKEVAGFIDDNFAWIKATLADMEAAILPRYRQWPPQELTLPAMDVRLVFTYDEKETDGAMMSAVAPACEGFSDLAYAIGASIHDKRGVAKEIAVHLKKLARSFLPPLLASQALLHDFHYARVSIRGQRSVWGSYSSSGTLSLNYKLLFLSRELIDYVLLHELAHTVHLDHSEAFWQLLCRVNVNARTLDRSLAQAGPQVPPWLELTGTR